MPSAVKRQNFLRLNNGRLAFFSLSLSLLSLRRVKRAVIFIPIRKSDTFDPIGVKYQLLAHAAFSVQKTGQFNRAIRFQFGNCQCCLSHRHGWKIKDYLPNDTGFFLFRSVIDGKFNHRNPGRCIAYCARFSDFSTNNGLIAFQNGWQSTPERRVLRSIRRQPIHRQYPLRPEWLFLLDASSGMVP